MQDLDAALADDGMERAQVFLTNALTGWEPRTTKPLPFPELEEERDRAERVKQETPILVILSNPPYNGFAGMAVDEERELSEAYRTTKRVRRPEGQGLNDLYVRFFRMAERRIAEKTGRGVVCFISNYSWLDRLSFTGMRERYLEAFDAIRIDCLNGDSRETGKVAPDGSPDPSIFSTESDPVGIRVGTAIATLVRKADHMPAREVDFRHLWGQAKRAELMQSSEAEPGVLYHGSEPVLPLGLPFVRTAVSVGRFGWPALPDLFPASFPGVTTNRDSFLVDTDLDRLKARVADYFNAALSHEEIGRRYPVAMKTTTSVRQDARSVREARLVRDGPDKAGFLRYCHRPFDTRWLYWEAESGDGEASHAVEALAESAARGRSLAALLDPDMSVPGVTQGTLRLEIAAIAVPSTDDKRNMTGGDFAITAGWGHYGTSDVVMPGQGRIVEREYTPDERGALGEAISTLGAKTLDVYLNNHAFWRNVPAKVWTYKLGGYQVLKKWLSYRELDVLGRALKPEEIQHFTDTARRIVAVLAELGSSVSSDR